jgi:hypothetical protein
VTASEGSPRRRAGLVCWLAAFLFLSSLAHGNFETTDSAFTLHAANVLWQRGDSGLRRPDQGGELLGERLGALHIHARGREGKAGRNGLAYVWFPMGHVYLLAPFACVGAMLERAFPAADAAFRAAVAPNSTDEGLAFQPSYVEGHPVLMQSLVATVVPAACFATTLCLLYLLARRLGAERRDALLTALVIGFATQAFSVGREQLSDGPGLMLLLLALLPVVRLWNGDGARWLAFAAGAASGAAVLLRYQTAFAVVAFAAALAAAAWRRRRFGDLVWFALGGLPWLVLFLGVNHAKFGDPFDTGYPKADTWFDQPVWLGLPKLFVGAGRGVLWLSPVLWLVLLPLVRRRSAVRLRWLAWVLFWTPMLMFATARGWQGGQCWASRYVTPGVVALLAIVLPQLRPWRRWPVATWLFVLFGVFGNVTSVVAPVRGVQQLTAQAVRADLEARVAAGEWSRDEAAAIDPADYAGWHPRYSPLHVNWSYALRSRRFGFEDEAGQPRHGSTNTIEPLFGVAARSPDQALAPMRWEDRRGRHLWWLFWGELAGVSAWVLVVPVWLAAIVAAVLGLRRLLR